MPRKKTTPDRLNPLQRMFGTFLRLERKRLRLTTRAVAEQLNISETYYRLVESGGATFNQSLIFKLVEILEIGDFQRLALYLVGAHWVNAEMTSLTSSGGGNGADRKAMESLAKRSEDFEYFHQQTKEYYRLDEGSDSQQAFLEDKATLQVRDFLTRSDYVRPTSSADIVHKAIPPKLLLALPTLNVEIVTRLFADLVDRPFLYTTRGASAWEERNAASIRTVRGLFDKPEMILGTSNLDSFHYGFLLGEDFRSLRFAFVHSAKNQTADSLKADFAARLNDARRSAGVRLIEAKHLKGVSFGTLKAKSARDEDLIRALLPEAATPDGDYKAYWSFEEATALGKEIPIGFVGKQNSLDVWNLGLGESAAKADLFDELWTAVEASS